MRDEVDDQHQGLDECIGWVKDALYRVFESIVFAEICVDHLWDFVGWRHIEVKIDRCIHNFAQEADEICFFLFFV